MAEVSRSLLMGRARTFLQNDVGCSVVINNFEAALPGENAEGRVEGSRREVPDALGWKLSYPVLVACAATRKAYEKDLRRPFRRNGKQGVGAVRLYMTPPGLVAPSEIPPGWGLVEVNGRRQASHVHGPKSGEWGPFKTPDFWWKKRNEQREQVLLLASVQHLRC